MIPKRDLQRSPGSAWSVSARLRCDEVGELNTRREVGKGVLRSRWTNSECLTRHVASVEESMQLLYNYNYHMDPLPPSQKV